MNFVAIDFETANEKRNSACSLGVTVVENNEIVEERYWLIKPYEMRFNSMNIWIHGIKPEDVENEKNFGELWEEIKPYIENRFVVAHNASFDISVLRKLLDSYEISYPSFQYGCTFIMSKNHFDTVNHKLNTVANHVGFKFNHHHAGDDAKACATILINMIEQLNINSLEEMEHKLGISLGRVWDSGYKSSSSTVMESERKFSRDKITEVNVSCCESIFKDKVIVFTGPLSSMSRAQAMTKVKMVGALVGSSVTKKTSYLVTGIKNIRYLDSSYKSTKLRRAEMLMKEGQDIRIITEEEFLQNIN